MESEDKLILLSLAHEAIKSKLENRGLEFDAAKISSVLKQRRGTFVTLKISGWLRGCIGHLAPVQALYKDVVANARAAAFLDPRFAPLTKSEFEKTAIEISVLSASEKLAYESWRSLIENLEKNKPGVILKQGGRVTTFLPDVWNELPGAKQFLSHLCLKAGLNPDAWTQGPEIETYTIEKISAD